MVIYPIPADLGPMFLPLEPRLRVQPHEALKNPLDPNLPSLLRESHSSGFPFDICMGKWISMVHRIQDVAGVKGVVNWIPRTQQKWTASENGQLR